jgi:hypothetical protein
MGAPERKAGSNLGRPAIDWNEAFLSYAALPSDQRSYQAVAARDGVSVRTVETHGRRERWKDRACQLDRESAAAAATQLAQDRAVKLADLGKLIDASFVSFAQDLRAGRVRMSPADLARLHKLQQELWALLDAAQEAIPPAEEAPDEQLDPVERKLQVLRALHDAGALQHLQQLVDQAPAPTGHGDDPAEQADDARNDDGRRRDGDLTDPHADSGRPDEQDERREEA